jgi:hypothetical protein
MTKGSSRKDLLDLLSNYLAHNKGLPVFLSIGLALVGLVLGAFPGLAEVGGLAGWLVRSHALLHLSVIIGLVGILIGDAL